MKVVIIGAGNIGQAIEKILQGKDVTIKLWDKDIAKVPDQKSLAEIVPSASFLFLCLQSWVMREAVTSLLPYLDKKTIVISLAKGIEEKSKKTIDELLGELLPENQPFALLSGSMLADEFKQDMVGFGIIGSKQKETYTALAELFQNTNLHYEYSADMHGLALAGVLKNVYAIGLGIVSALKLGENFKGWFVQKAIREMTEIIELLGGQQETVLGIAGLGDFVATGFSPYSRNRKFGDELVKTGECCAGSEGFASLPSLIELIGSNVSKFIILNALQQMVINKKNPKEVFEQLLGKL